MKKLTKHGNSLALVIERPILDLLKIDAATPLEVSTDGDILIVKPHRKRRKNKQVKEALEWVNAHYGNALKRVAEKVSPVFLSVDDVLEIRHDQIRRYGGTPGVRDISLLLSAIAQPSATFEGQYLLATYMKWRPPSSFTSSRIPLPGWK